MRAAAAAVTLIISFAAACRPGETTWIVHPDHVGAVQFGVTATGTRPFGDSSTSFPQTGCTYWRPDGRAFMVEDGIVVRIDVDSASPPLETAEGIGIGSTEAEIRSAYGEHVTIQLHKYQWEAGWRYFVYLPPTDSLHAIVFETDGNTVRTFRAGRRPQVQYVERCG